MSQNDKKEIAVNINLDTTPIYYTDSVYITVNEDGVVFDVMQQLANTSQSRIVSRIGMSRVHAKKFASELSKLLAITEGHARTSEKEKQN